MEELSVHITNERSQSKKTTYCMTPTIRHSEKKNMETVKRSAFTRDQRTGKDEQAEQRGFLGQ